MKTKTSVKLPPQVLDQFRKWGRLGGLRGTREDKQRAGRRGAKAQRDKLARELAAAPTPHSAISPRDQSLGAD